MQNALTNQIRVEWPQLGGSGPSGRLVLLAGLVLLTHYRYPEMPVDLWLNLIAVFFAGLGFAPPSPPSSPPSPPLLESKP